MLKLNRGFLWALALLLISLSYWPQFMSFGNVEKEVQAFQTTLSKKENQATAFLEQLRQEDQSGHLRTLKSPRIEKLATQGISFFVYHQTNLAFWTEDETAFTKSLLVAEAGLYEGENGWYHLIKNQRSDSTYLALILIKRQYDYQNRYLKNAFQADFQFPNLYLAEEKGKGKFQIFTQDGELLLTLTTKEDLGLQPAMKLVLGLLSLLGIVLFFYLLAASSSALLQLFVVLLARLLFFFFLPEFWQSWAIFQPSLFALSEWVPSLGDLGLHALTLFYVIYLWRRRSKQLGGFVLPFVEIALGLGLSVLGLWLIKESVYNSSLHFDLNDLFHLSLESYLCFLIFGLCFFSALQFFELALYRLAKHSGFQALKRSNWYKGPIPSILVLLFFSALSVLVLEQSMQQKQEEEKEFILKKLAEEKDPIAEYLFLEVQEKIQSDEQLHRYLKNYWSQKEQADQYLQEQFFNGYWKKYNLVFTPCLPNDSLYLSTGNTYAACRDYFMERLRREGELISSTNFFQLQNFPGRIEYLAEVDIPIDSNTYTLYIELVSNLLTEGQGYPELLLDAQSRADDIDLGDYAYAIYEKGELIYYHGDYNYPTHISVDSREKERLFNHEKLGHYHTTYSKNGETILVLSQTKGNWLLSLTAWAYLFVIYAVLFLLLAVWLKYFPFHFRLQFTDFSTKLQLFLVGTLLFALLSFSLGTIYYIQKQYQKKNFNNLREKVRSINMELEQKLATEEVMAEPLTAYVEGLLIKFSNVFYTDINLYNKEGKLYASSRPEVFEHGLKSLRMNPFAYQALKLDQRSEWVQEESIGEMDYLSAYIPFRNYNNDVLAYLNLPYFSKQDEFQEEISAFIVSTLNIYVGIFTLALLVSVLLVNQLSKPLLLIRRQIGRLKLGSSVELIKWDSQDEIGALVNEYNRIAIELNESAEQLAQSEREGAWREMAKQVAHEIKNPLTPMKLSIQHLQMAAQSNADNWQKRLERTAQTLIEQIDTLSNIADAFSSFAKLPEKEMQTIDLVPILETSVHLYESEVEVKLEKEKGLEKAVVWGDKDQLLRLFNNLLKNAVYATQETERASIKIHLGQEDKHFLIRITDNGIGIPKEQLERIFEPSFTTKSSGTGLGLAMAKSIVSRMEGKIWVESEEGKGANFYIELRKRGSI
ncbi:MAG: HAMP domain-containing sensor histidine kinase [Vicingaceae bacterium]